MVVWPPDHQLQSWTGLVYSLTKPDGAGSFTLLTQGGSTRLSSDLPLPPLESQRSGETTLPTPPRSHPQAFPKSRSGKPPCSHNNLVHLSFSCSIYSFLHSILHSTNIPALSVLGAGDTNWDRTCSSSSASTKLACTSCPPLLCASGSDTGQAPREGPLAHGPLAHGPQAWAESPRGKSRLQRVMAGKRKTRKGEPEGHMGQMDEAVND